MTKKQQKQQKIQKQDFNGISVVIPVYNEAGAIADTLVRLRDTLEKIGCPYEIIAVDDGSSDDSAAIAMTHDGVRLFRHPINSGYGRSLKTGVLNAKYNWIAITDADGTYPVEDLPRFIEEMNKGFDMVVGQRTNALQLDRPLKRMFRRMFIGGLSLMLNRRIEDPNSGLRVFRRDLVMEYLPFLCDAFSFTTSITVFAFGSGRFVSYIPITYEKRTGTSKVSHIRDTMRTLQLIMQGIVYNNPVKFFLLLSLLFSFGVALPSWALTFINSTLANYFFIGGITVALLIGMGVMCDTIRIAIMRGQDRQNPDK